jgi:hypothetical protein
VRKKRTRAWRKRTYEAVARALEAGGGLDEEATRFRDYASDAGVYLLDLAEVAARTSSFVRQVLEVREAVERDGRWGETVEWRISTTGTEAIEGLPTGGFRVRCDYHGTLGGDFATFGEAFEAMHVLGRIQQHLFYALGWASDLRRPRADDDQYAYLYRLAREARAEPLPELGGRLRSSTRPWGDAVEAEVCDRSLSMSAAAPTLERAAEFAGVYERLQADLARILDWRWL